MQKKDCIAWNTTSQSRLIEDVIQAAIETVIY